MALEGGSSSSNDRISRRRLLGLPDRNLAAPRNARPETASANAPAPEAVPVQEARPEPRPEPKPRLLDPVIAQIPAAMKVTKEAGKEVVKTTAKSVGKVGLYATAVAFVGYIWGVKWLTDKSVAGFSSILDSFYTNGKEGAYAFFAGLFGASAGGGKKDHHDDHHPH